MSLGYQEKSFVKAFDKSFMETVGSPNLTIEEKGDLVANARSCHPQIRDEEDKLVYTFDVSHFQTMEIGIKFFENNKFAVEGHHTLPNGIHRDVEHVFELPPNVNRNGWKQHCSHGTLTVEFPKIHLMEQERGAAAERKRKQSPLI